jgi:ornithine cyclodeaminase
MRAAIDSQKKAFLALAGGHAEAPLRTSAAMAEPHAVSLFMPARSGENLGIKIVSVVPDNSVRGLPVVPAIVLLMDITTGQPLALLDATYLTVLRTGAASALATDLLARPDARTGAIIGSGGQAAGQLLAICSVRPIERVLVASRDPAHVQAFIRRMQPEVTAKVMHAMSAAEAVRAADVVCTATTSARPVVHGRDLQAGAHVNGVGSYTIQMQEVDSEVVRRAERIFVDSRATALAEAGDVVIPLQEGLIQEADLIELGAVAAGQQPGRTSAEGITFFKSVGIAVQDVAAAAEVLRRAREMGLGKEIDW